FILYQIIETICCFVTLMTFRIFEMNFSQCQLSAKVVQSILSSRRKYEKAKLTNTFILDQQRFSTKSYRDLNFVLRNVYTKKPTQELIMQRFATLTRDYLGHENDCETLMCMLSLTNFRRYFIENNHIQTGGNLFGLWTTSGSAVVHVVLGPGQGCRRTSTSFHQDLKYMARVGRFVNEGYMLCHIGEWHSHHNLSLSKPSAEDEGTIRRNFPRGMSKFLVIIANIRNGDTIKLSPYFFTNGGERYAIAEYEVLKSDSPFSTDDKIAAEINLGTVSRNSHENPRNTDSNHPTPPGRPEGKVDIELKPLTNHVNCPQITQSHQKKNTANICRGYFFNEKTISSRPVDTLSYIYGLSRTETWPVNGGNLFGLWTTSGSAVIHVVLGPGQHCRRTSTSFHQDLEYMVRVGRFVNEGYMLCHIGEWRSHHNLSLSKPSAGDENTIRRNFPRGMSKFLVIIANITNGDTIKLFPYFFTDGDSDEANQISSLVGLSTSASKPNPSSSDSLVNSNIPASKANTSVHHVDSRTPNPKASQSTPNSKVDQNTYDSKVNQSSSESQPTPNGSTREEPMDTEDSDLHPPGDHERSNPDKNKNEIKTGFILSQQIIRKRGILKKKNICGKKDHKINILHVSRNISPLGTHQIAIGLSKRTQAIPKLMSGLGTSDKNLLFEVLSSTSEWLIDIYFYILSYTCTHMYMNDFNAMCAEVHKQQHIQTGGNLFGLWTTLGSAVIRIVIGPGQGCKRTTTSFHQDSEYLVRVGRFVNEKHKLCHIGEWHSHHNLILDKPSAEDEITITRNFLQGTSKFLVIIANIKNGHTTKLSPYFFTHGESDGPFSTDDKIVEQIHLLTKAPLWLTKMHLIPRFTKMPTQVDPLLMIARDQWIHKIVIFTFLEITKDRVVALKTPPLHLNLALPPVVKQIQTRIIMHNHRYWMNIYASDLNSHSMDKLAASLNILQRRTQFPDISAKVRNLQTLSYWSTTIQPGQSTALANQLSISKQEGICLGCRRTATSFHQDSEYMARVGRFVNDGHMLCHIDSDSPFSTDDQVGFSLPGRSSKRSLVPRPLSTPILRFCMYGWTALLSSVTEKANTSNAYHIETGGNLFGLWTTSGSAVIHVVLGRDHIVNDKYTLCHIGEWHSYHRLSLDQTSAGVEQAVRCNFPQGMSKFLVIVANMNNEDRAELSPYFFTDGGTSYEKAEFAVLESENPFSNDAKNLATIERGAEGNQDKQVTSSNIHTSIQTKIVSLDGKVEIEHHTAQTTDNPPENGSAQSQTAKEITMKDIYDELEKLFGQGKVEIEHQPAKLYRELTRDYFSSSSSGPLYNLEKPLTNRVNILLSIKKNCCYSCKTFTATGLQTRNAPSEATVIARHAGRIRQASSKLRLTQRILCTTDSETNQTRGNLFGLWTTSGSAVIRLVVGPGQGCKRTSTSFHQDSEYMARVGRFVNEEHMLCHIGEWRSHHSLILDKPGAEDEISIRRNFPQDVSKFLLIIANIRNGDSVLSPYFFTDGGTRYEKAEFVVLESKNPFSNDAKILAKIERGAEGNQGRASLTGSGPPRNTGPDSHQNQNTSPTYTQVASRSSHQNPQQTGSNSHQSRNTSPTYTQNQNTRPTYTQVASTNGQPSGENANDVTPTDTFYTESPKGVPILPNLPADHTSAQTSATTEYEKAITKEIIMKDTYDELEKFFGQENVEIERTSYDDINMIFEHESYRWMVCFPKTFPNQPAQLYRVSKRRHFSSSSPCPHYNLEKPLTNHVNILLSIKKNCRLTCKICENISKENLNPEVEPILPVDHTAQTTNNPPGNDTAQNQSANTANETATTKEIILKKIYDGLEKYFGSEGKVAIERTSHGEVQMTFKHYQYHWMLRFPETFPNRPAQLLSAFNPKYLSPCSNWLLESPLTNYVNILLSIKKSCYSSLCKICKTITKENLTKPATAKPMSNKSLGDVVDALTNEITMSEMATPKTLAGQTQSDGSYKIAFEHNYSKWLITFPAVFPDKPAEVYKQGSCYGTVRLEKIDLSSNTRHKQEPLVSSNLIMLAIYTSCRCWKCRSKKN
ncbi:Hypothetical predicted protein, partial [Paramuricea clavata]